MKVSDLVFSDFNKRVAAVHRNTGEIVWQWKAQGLHNGVTLLLGGDRLIVSVQGCLFALDALTGRELWSNELVGFGYGIASLASVHGHTSAEIPLIAARQAATTTAAAGGGAAGA